MTISAGYLGELHAADQHVVAPLGWRYKPDDSRFLEYFWCPVAWKVFCANHGRIPGLVSAELWPWGWTGLEIKVTVYPQVTIGLDEHAPLPILDSNLMHPTQYWVG